MISKFKCETHKLRKRREGTRLPYVCLECGKEFKILNGLLAARNAAEEKDYYKRRREPLAKMLSEVINPEARLQPSEKTEKGQ